TITSSFTMVEGVLFGSKWRRPGGSEPIEEELVYEGCSRGTRGFTRQPHLKRGPGFPPGPGPGRGGAPRECLLEGASARGPVKGSPELPGESARRKQRRSLQMGGRGRPPSPRVSGLQSSP